MNDVAQINPYVNMSPTELMKASDNAIKLLDIQKISDLKKEFERRLRLINGVYDEDFE